MIFLISVSIRTSKVYYLFFNPTNFKKGDLQAYKSCPNCLSGRAFIGLYYAYKIPSEFVLLFILKRKIKKLDTCKQDKLNLFKW